MICYISYFISVTIEIDLHDNSINTHTNTHYRQVQKECKLKHCKHNNQHIDPYNSHHTRHNIFHFICVCMNQMLNESESKDTSNKFMLVLSGLNFTYPAYWQHHPPTPYQSIIPPYSIYRFNHLMKWQNYGVDLTPWMWRTLHAATLHHLHSIKWRDSHLILFVKLSWHQSVLYNLFIDCNLSQR